MCACVCVLVSYDALIVAVDDSDLLLVRLAGVVDMGDSGPLVVSWS